MLNIVFWKRILTWNRIHGIASWCRGRCDDWLFHRVLKKRCKEFHLKCRSLYSWYKGLRRWWRASRWDQWWSVLVRRNPDTFFDSTVDRRLSKEFELFPDLGSHAWGCSAATVGNSSRSTSTHYAGRLLRKLGRESDSRSCCLSLDVTARSLTSQFEVESGTLLNCTSTDVASGAFGMRSVPHCCTHLLFGRAQSGCMCLVFRY